MKRLFTIIFLSVLLCCAGIAQRTVYYDDHSGLSSNRVGAAVQDGRGLIWFATWNGLNVYDGYDFYWVKMNHGDGNSLGNDRIRNMMLAPNGNLWCCTESGVYEFDLKTNTFRNLPDSRRKDIIRQTGGSWHKLTDRQDNVWMGYGNGVYKTSQSHHPAIPLTGTRGFNARALLADRDGRVWVCTSDDETVRIYRAGGTLQSTIPIGHKVYSLFQGPNGNVFAGCKPGALLRLTPATVNGAVKSLKQQLISSDEVYDIQRDRHGRLWIAAFGEGVKCCPNPEADAPTLSASLGGRFVKKILITPRGNIVAASAEGLLIGHIDEKDYRRTRLRRIARDGKDGNSLANNATTDIVQDSRGTIYIATESSGIDMISEDALFSAKTRFTHFCNDNSSLNSDFCRSLTLFGDSTLMVVGNNSMVLFNPHKDVATHYNHVFWDDTCHFAEGRPAVFKDGSIVFGTEAGAYLVKKQSMLGRGYIPPLVIARVTINGKENERIMPMSDTIRLAPGERNMSLKYAALDYGENTHILYRTSLDGLPWTHASLERVTTMFDIEPGTYELRIQSTDRYGRWVDNIHTVTIIAEPHWYETWWARTLMVFFLAFFVVALLHSIYYIGVLKKQRSEALEKYMSLIGSMDSDDGDAPSAGQKDAGARKPAKSTDKDERTLVAKDIKAEDQWFLDRIRHYIEENIGNSDANIDDMAATAATSRSTLNRRLNSLIGITAAQLLIDARMQHAANLLTKGNREKGSASVTDIAYRCGYTDPRYFSRCFKQKYGVAPSEYNG